MIAYVFFVWALLYTATAIEAQAVQIMAKTTPPPPRGKVCCNYIMKEGEKEIEGGTNGEEGLCKEAG